MTCAARHELNSVINRIRAYQSEFMPPGLDFEVITAAAAPECPLVYLITTTQGSLALIVPLGTKALRPVTSSGSMNFAAAIWMAYSSSETPRVRRSEATWSGKCWGSTRS